jgi:hypothetical protein
MQSFILKTAAFICSLPFIFLYCLVAQSMHIAMFGQPYPFNSLAFAYVLVTYAHLSYIVPPGTSAEITFCGKATGWWVEDGVVTLPNFLHITVSLMHGFAILFGVCIPYEEAAANKGRTNIEHFADQRLYRYNANVQMSPFVAACTRLVEGVIVWTLRTRHLVLMRLGFLGMVAIFLLASFDTLDTRARQEYNKMERAVSTSVKQLFSNDRSAMWLTVHTQLNECAIPPVMPAADLFEVNQETGTALFRKDLDGSGRNYFQYNAPNASGKSIRTVRQPLCATVPAGKEIFFATDRKPSCVINMRQDVGYMKKRTWFEKTEIFVLEGRMVGDRPATAHWNYLHHRWGEVNSSGYYLKAKALERSEIGAGQLGGLVCF